MKSFPLNYKIQFFSASIEPSVEYDQIFLVRLQTKALISETFPYFSFFCIETYEINKPILVCCKSSESFHMFRKDAHGTFELSSNETLTTCGKVLYIYQCNLLDFTLSVLMQYLYSYYYN